MSKKKDFSTITIKLHPDQQEHFEALLSKLKSEHGFNKPVSQIVLSLMGFMPAHWLNTHIEDARNSLRSSILSQYIGNFFGYKEQMLHPASEVQRIFDALSPEMKAVALRKLKECSELDKSWLQPDEIITVKGRQ